MARPSKTTEEIKSIRFTIHLNQKQSERILKKAEINGLSISAYFRESALSSDDTRLPRIRRETILEIRKIGINVNQIARHINEVQKMGGNINYSELKIQLEKIHSMLCQQFDNLYIK